MSQAFEPSTPYEGAASAEATGSVRRPVVLQVVPALETGGVERGTVDIAAAIARAGWTSLVASSGGHMVVELDRSGAEHITLGLDTKNPLALRRNAVELAQIIRDRGVDIIHARSRGPAWSALRASRQTGIRLVTTYHGTYNAQTSLKRRYNSVMAKGEKVIAISEFIAGHVNERYSVDPGRMVTIPRGVDVDIFDPARTSAERIIQLATAWRLPDGMPIIMLPARLTRWKGQGVLIAALAALGRQDIRCLLVGSSMGRDNYRKELEKTIARHSLNGIVHLIDNCRDMPAAYMLADVVVSASTDPEAFGRILAEAQAMGRPVVATDHGGALETVRPGETGWLVPPGKPEALAAAITEALELDSEKRETMAREARKHVCDNFTVKMMSDRTLEVYQQLLASGPAR